MRPTSLTPPLYLNWSTRKLNGHVYVCSCICVFCSCICVSCICVFMYMCVHVYVCSVHVYVCSCICVSCICVFMYMCVMYMCVHGIDCTSVSTFFLLDVGVTSTVWYFLLLILLLFSFQGSWTTINIHSILSFFICI